MPKPKEMQLTEAIKADLRDAWAWIKETRPEERVYAFGMYTPTETAFSFEPFACGVEGLRQVAEVYVSKKIYPNLSESMQALKWSVADSPYQGKLPASRTSERLKNRLDPTEAKISDATSAQETRARLNAAIDAIKALDDEGLFGIDHERDGIILLIAAGDCSDDFELKPAKKLNPPRVFKAYQDLFKKPTLGRWTELGSKNCYHTKQIRSTPDQRLIATASDYTGCVFDVADGKRLLCRGFPDRKDYNSVVAVAISRRGDRVAFVTTDNRGESRISIVDGAAWRNQHDIPLKTEAYWASFVSELDGLWYAIGCKDAIHVLACDGSPIAQLKAQESNLASLLLTPDGTRLIAIDEKSGIRVWRVSDWSLEHHRPDARGTQVSFDPTGSRIATVLGSRLHIHGNQYEFLSLWTYPEFQLLKQHRFPKFRLESVQFSPDGRIIACGMGPEGADRTHSAVLIDPESGTITRRLIGPYISYGDFLFLPARNSIALAGLSCGSARQLVLWELSDPGSERTLS
jgi:hypothetical protein